MNLADRNLVATTAQLLAEHLPPGWSITPHPAASSLRVTSAQGRAGALPLSVQRGMDPRAARQLHEDAAQLVVAPYLSAATREALTQRGVSYADPTGNIRLVLEEPGLFVLTHGAPTNPNPDPHRMTLRGAKAARIVCALAEVGQPLGVRELAQLAGTDPGYVSRLLKHLDREALLDRGPRGQVARVHWRPLLHRWTEDAPLPTRAAATSWLAPRGLSALLDDLRAAALPHLITGTAAAARVAPHIITQTLAFYVEDPDDAARRLGLRDGGAGVNVTLLTSEDPALLAGALGTREDHLCYAALPLVAADLLTGARRSPQDAADLLDWMAAHEAAWRG